MRPQSRGRAGRDASAPVVHEMGPIERCPACDGTDFLIDERNGVIFRCLGCGQGWAYELGWVWPVPA